MINAFDFATVPQIVFGAGTLSEAGKLVRPWGKRGLLVTGRTPSRADFLVKLLVSVGVDVTIFTVANEPSVETVAQGLAAARSCKAELVIGFGGGSVIDTAKAIAGLAANPGEPLDYLEVVGKGKPLGEPALPWMAIPTTAGTGAEVTRNAVLYVPEKRVKVSLRSSHLLARVALVDPELMLDLPPAVTAASGMDALTQLIEAYVCCRTNPMVDVLCRDNIPRAVRALHLVWTNPRDLEARSALAQAALASGVALANAGLGAVHGFAGPIGGMFSAPHGAVCAALLPPVIEANAAALKKRAPDNPALVRYQEIAGWLTGRKKASIADGVRHVNSLVAKLHIPKLSAYGITPDKVPEIVTQAQKASSMKANPIVLTADELSDVVLEAL
ncbi:MAG: iron-containing alcohol dehydrogenase [Nibricoccus sp.]